MTLESWSEMLFQKSQRRQQNTNQKASATEGEVFWDLVELRESNYNLRGDKILTLPKVNTTKYGLKSLRYEGAKLWNKLPNEYRKADIISLHTSRPKGFIY